MILIFLVLFEVVAGNQLTGPKEVKQCAGRPIHIIYQPAHASGPLTIADNKKEGFFTIHMTNVKPGDNGWYWCAIERVSRHVSISMELIISSEKAQHCSVPELTTSCNIIETTTLPVTTSRLTTPETTETTRTSQTASSTTYLTSLMPEVITEDTTFAVSLIHKIWCIMRWILFIGLCSFLLSFIIYFDL
ncbi:natural cytotoxicity triggering receptor 2-like isoform X3 [Pygocentrus nattereri]|uniref:natural cytotoxicity triggering receptor 2-like isoform X3 n=1 Tax=Pygocentrus nattereri TaxID=42514 RepID=UPI0008143C85|nr:natural cytotoxicity triggering receptor 2-like isoform X3 [Pygocentrus nattereri]